MNTIKIASMEKGRFSEYYEIKVYRKNAMAQIAVKKYQFTKKYDG